MWMGRRTAGRRYNTERLEIAEVLRYVPNVIVLSGDRHEFAAVSVLDTITEFSTSPLSMFYLPCARCRRSTATARRAWTSCSSTCRTATTSGASSRWMRAIRTSPWCGVSVQIDGKEEWRTTTRANTSAKFKARGLEFRWARRGSARLDSIVLFALLWGRAALADVQRGHPSQGTQARERESAAQPGPISSKARRRRVGSTRRNPSSLPSTFTLTLRSPSNRIGLLNRTLIRI
ncbi:hypothetical protein L1887_60017 [Cichorium endivia]|nr:hypothetical protein L1887_60017 [Cichorium endivia]